MKTHTLILAVFSAAALAAPPAGPRDEDAPTVYVPYADLASIIAPTDQAVLMDRAAFARLLAAAEANARAADSIDVAQIARAAYRGEVKGDALVLTGTLTVTSMSDRPVAVGLGFCRVGLTKVSLDGKDAPLGFDRDGRLVLIVTGRGDHAVELAGSTVLKELDRGGMQFSLSLPPAAAGEMLLSAPGDLEVHATGAAAAARYDRPTDRTNVRLTLGGCGTLAVVLMGNGRQEDQRAILLGTSATTVNLGPSFQMLHCLYTVQALRRGVRELSFSLPNDWTVTDVSCPALVKWSVLPPEGAGKPKRLLVRLRTAGRGTKALHIQAEAPRADQPRPAGAPAAVPADWAGPNVRLEGADFQHGYLLVDAAEGLRVRGRKLVNARRDDLSRAARIPGLLAGAGGQLFYHWSDDWSVRLELAAAAPRKSSEDRHELSVTADELLLTATFDVTAVGGELFHLAFRLPAAAGRWQLRSVTVNGKADGFEYRLVEAGDKRTLRIALAEPIQPEAVGRVAVSMRHVPADWNWPPDAPAREVSLPLVQAEADSVSGVIGVAAAGDLDLAPAAAPAGLAEVSVGRMASLKLAGNVQLAYTYDRAVDEPLTVRVSRRAPRLAADGVALVSVAPAKLTAHWRIAYDISRARARVLYLLADKALGQNLKITTPGRHLAAKAVVAPGRDVALAAGLAEAYDLWQLTLDSQTLGRVVVDVEYDRPASGPEVRVPLVRPIGAAQTSEVVAVQASEELAVDVSATGAAAVDAVEIPPLPVRATRLLAAFRLEAPTTPAGAAAAVLLTTKVHDKYAIPAALAQNVELTTYLGPDGSQRTQAALSLVNAGMQFLAIRLPAGAQLWSIQAGGTQVKPQRSAGGDYLVSLARSASAQDVKVVYAVPGGAADLSRVALGGVTLPGVKVNHLDWTVVCPPGCYVAKQYTDLAVTHSDRPQPAWEWLAEAAAAPFAMRNWLLAPAREMARPSRAVRPDGTDPSSLSFDSQEEAEAPAPSRRRPAGPS